MNTVGEISQNGSKGISTNLKQHQIVASAPSMELANLNKNKIGFEHIVQDQKLINQNQQITNNFYPPQENYTDMNIQQPIPLFNQGNHVITQAPIQQPMSQSNGNITQSNEAQNIQQEFNQQIEVSKSDSFQGYNQNFNTIINNQNNMQQHQQQQNSYGHQPHAQVGVPQQQQQHPQQHHQHQPNQGFQQYTGAPQNYQHQNPQMMQHHQALPHMHQQHHQQHQQHHVPQHQPHHIIHQPHHQQHHAPQHVQHHPHQQHQQVAQQMAMPHNTQPIHQQHHEQDPQQVGMPNLDPKRTYRKKKTWMLYLNITIETPELDNRLNESFEIEIGSNQRLKILHQTIMSQVKNLELRELIRKEKTYIYIEGKEPVARKSKSLAEMGVKDGDHLIVTTEMKLPFDEISEDEDPIMDVNIPQMRGINDEDPYGYNDNTVPNQPVHANPIEFHKTGQLTPPGNREPNQMFGNAPEAIVGSNLPANQQENIGISSKKPQHNQMHNPGNMASSFPSKMVQNGPQANSVNGAIPKGPVNQKPPGKETGNSKKSGRKATPVPDRKTKEQNAPKSPAARKPKDIQYTQILVLQQHFKDEDLKSETPKLEDGEPQADNADDEGQMATMDDKKDGEAEQADGEKKEEAGQDENQIDSRVQVEQVDKQEGDEEEHEEEIHEEHNQSVSGEPNEVEPYDPNDIWQLDINSKNKVKSIKKMILEKIKLDKGKAKILVYKKNTETQASLLVQENQKDQWVPFTDSDNDAYVKVLQGQQIAFKCYFEISVCVEGRGHSYKQNLRVDPKDSMDRFLRKNTHFWKIFMTRGINKCVAGFQNKGDADITLIAPDLLDKSFVDNGINDKCQITLIECRGNLHENSEEGEDEMNEEEFEDEQVEIGEDGQEEGEGGKDQPKEEDAPGDGVAQVVEESEDPDIKKKASDVLFNDQNDKAEGKQE